MARFTDAFTRADSSDLGANYTVATGGTGFTILSNRARSAGTSAAQAILSAGQGPSTADQFAAITLVGTTGTSVALAVRASSSDGVKHTGYLLRCSASAIGLLKIVDSVTTTLASDVAITRAAGDRLAMSVVGSTITAYRNGTQVFQVSDTSLTTGRPAFRNGATADVLLDDFDAGDYNATDSANVNGLPAAAASSPPGQVTGVTVGAVTESSIALSWTATSGATAYTVEYRASGASTWTARSAVTGTSDTVTGLAASTGYELRVTASNSAGAGTPSATSTATTSAPAASPPGQVTGLAVGTATTTTLPLTWNAVSGASSYTVEYRVSGQTAWTAVTGVTGTAYTLATLASGTACEARVTAVNAAGSGTPSSVVTGTTVASSSVVITENQPTSSGRPVWRGLGYAYDGTPLIAGGSDLLHRMEADFYGTAGTYTPPTWLVTSADSVELTAGAGGLLRLRTAATSGASAILKMATPPATTGYRAALLEVRHQSVGAASPNADYRIFIGSGNVGASAVHFSGDDTAYVCSQGENNRTITAQAVLGADATRRRHIGLLVSFATKEAWLMEGDCVTGYRDCSATWTDGTADIGISITTKSATAMDLRLASVAVSLYA